MPEYNIRGVPVHFPYQAYPCQEMYMEKVIQCLQESMQERKDNPTVICSRNALLESPTGTGKTMCLLCSSYAWLLDYKKKMNGQHIGSIPKIIFTSRTHSQLTHAIKELKKSAYTPEIVVMGSREQTCINPDVISLKGFQQISKCTSLVRSGGCKYYTNFTDLKKSGQLFTHEKEDEIEDIEDLLEKGLKKCFCPFFYSREKQKVAEIIFMPYNYLIDPLLRKKVNVDISNSIVIFDEAHNVQKLCAEASSFDFSTINISKAIAEIEKCRAEMDKLTIDPSDIQKSTELKSDCFDISSALLDLDIYIDEMEIPEEGSTSTGDSIYEIFSYASIHPSTWETFNEKIRNVTSFLQNKKQTCSGLERVKEAVERVFSEANSEENFKNFFKVYIYYSKKQPGVMNTNLSSEHLQFYTDALATRDKKKDFRKSKTLSFWCFNPGLSMQNLAKEGPLSFILTSGTLSPMESFAYELGLNFPIRLENPHVVNRDQICVMAAQCGPGGTKLNSSFTNRASEPYLREVGSTLLNLSRVVPDGLLVFFPSYTLMDQCIEIWKKTNGNTKSTWDSVTQYKTIITEPKESTKLNQVIREYEDSIKNRKGNTTGACFFAVCRGRVSEGLDFINRNGRCCMIVGLPFPPLFDLKVKLKRDYLDDTAERIKKDNPNAKPITGSQWYAQESSRAVNQAIGRIIRHRYDYGAVVLCDERYATQNQRQQLSRWLQPHLKVAGQFSEVNNALSLFYKNVFQKFGIESEKIKPPPPPPFKKIPRFTMDLNQLYIAQAPPMQYRNIYHEDIEEYRNEMTSEKDIPLKAVDVQDPNRTSLQYYKKPIDNTTNEPKRYITKHVVYNNTSPSSSATSSSSNIITNNGLAISDNSSTLKRNVVLNTYINPQSIENRNLITNNNQTTTSPRNETIPPTTNKKQSAEYLELVKKMLPSDKYQEFKKLLIQFKEQNSSKDSKSTNSFTILVAKLVKLFGVNNLEIIKKFKNFISPKMTDTFDEIVKKQIAIQEEEISDFNSKKRKQEQVQFDLVTGAVIKKTKTVASNSISKPIVLDQESEPVVVTNQTISDIPLTLETSLLNGTTPEAPHPSPTIQQQLASTTEETEQHVPSATVCSICKENCKEPTAAKCGHVNCYSCWQQWLSYKLECPTCKAKVRPKLLTRLYF